MLWVGPYLMAMLTCKNPIKMLATITYYSMPFRNNEPHRLPQVARGLVGFGEMRWDGMVWDGIGWDGMVPCPSGHVKMSMKVAQRRRRCRRCGKSYALGAKAPGRATRSARTGSPILQSHLDCLLE